MPRGFKSFHYLVSWGPPRVYRTGDSTWMHPPDAPPGAGLSRFPPSARPIRCFEGRLSLLSERERAWRITQHPSKQHPIRRPATPPGRSFDGGERPPGRMFQGTCEIHLTESNYVVYCIHECSSSCKGLDPCRSHCQYVRPVISLLQVRGGSLSRRFESSSFSCLWKAVECQFVVSTVRRRKCLEKEE